LQVLRDEIPFRRLEGNTGGQVPVLDMLVETGLVKSKGDARRQLQQGAVSVNGRKLGAEEQVISATEAVGGSYYLLRKGSRDIALVELA
jgi:tyrosyl-tRNA synthetase